MVLSPLNTLALAVLVAGCSAAPPKPSRAVSTDVSGYLRALHSAGLFAGEVRMMRHGELLQDVRIGPLRRAPDLSPWGDQALVTPVGSITKLAVRVLVARLLDAGQLDLSLPLNTVLDAAEADPGHPTVTVGALLRHESLLPRNAPSLPGGLSEVARCLRAAPLPRALPYSNCGYLVLGAMLEAKTGEDLASLLSTHVTRPLGMRSTGFGVDSVAARVRWDGRALVPLASVETQRPASAASGLHASADDLVRLVRGAADPQFVSDATRRRLPDLTRHAGRTADGYIGYVGVHGDRNRTNL